MSKKPEHFIMRLQFDDVFHIEMLDPWGNVFAVFEGSGEQLASSLYETFDDILVTTPDGKPLGYRVRLEAKRLQK